MRQQWAFRLRSLQQQYLGTAAEQLRFAEEVLRGMITVSLIMLTGLLLLCGGC